MHYLLKTEPSAYSFADLQREGNTVWDGVTNPAAVKHLRGMPKGAKLVIYHTGDERRAVGTATVTNVDATDPKKPRVGVKAGEPLNRATTLAELKSNKLFKDSPLLKQSRLSVVPLTPTQYRFLVR